MCSSLVWNLKMPTAAYVGKRRHLVWDPTMLNFHVLKPGSGPQHTKLSCALAWFGTPKHRIFMCSSLVWNPQNTEIHVLRLGLEPQNNKFSCAQGRVDKGGRPRVSRGGRPGGGGQGWMSRGVQGWTSRGGGQGWTPRSVQG